MSQEGIYSETTEGYYGRSLPGSLHGQLITDHTMEIFILVSVVIIQSINIFGVATNIFNLITFCKQGAKDTVTISLTALTISDTASLTALMWTYLCYTRAFYNLDLPFEPRDLSYLIGGWPHTLCTRVTTWTTAYVTLERCLCVTLPLKVKSMFTPRRTMAYIASIYIFNIASVVPIYYNARLAWTFRPERNRTILGVIFLQNRAELETLAFTLNNVLPIVAFLLIIICTVILVTTLKMKSKWRLKSTVAMTNIKGENLVSERDAKVVKMVVLISTVFILCYLPATMLFVWMTLDTQMRLDGQRRNLYEVAWTVVFLFENVNASVNIFIYLRMSSKFRNAFLETFCKKIIKDNLKQLTYL